MWQSHPTADIAALHSQLLQKGEIDALHRNNYKDIKLLDEVMNVIERVITQLIRNRVNLDEKQFGFVPRRSATDAIFLWVRQTAVEIFSQVNTSLIGLSRPEESY